MPDFPVTQTTAYGVQAYALAGTRPQKQGEDSSLQPASSSPEQSGDKVSLSREGKALSAGQKTDALPDQDEQDRKKPAGTRQPTKKGSNQQPLDEAEFRQIQQLKSRDSEVRAHEQAHLSVAGQYASGGPSFSYQTGADGKRYAVGGSVPIDMGEESTPAATIMKMRTVKRAALAPANPSAADRQIAAQASMKEMQAIQELQATQLTKNPETTLQSANEKKMAPSVSQGNIGQQPQEPVPSANEPSAATRKLMNAAYKAMAALT